MSEISKSMEEYKECLKKYMRVIRHGDPDIVLKRGRKTVSPEHKKETAKRWRDKKQQEREEEKKAGIVQKKSPSSTGKVGRPRKNVEVSRE